VTQATKTEEAVQPVERSLAPLVLPEVALKIALGAKVSRKGDEAFVQFEGQTLRVHWDDCVLAQRAAHRLASKLPAKLEQLSMTDVIALMGFAHQYVTDGLFKPDAIRVIYYPVVADGSAFYRCILPAVILNKGAKVQAHVSRQRVAREALAYDVIVIQIDSSPATYQFAKALQEMGKKIVFEIDDAFDQLEPWHPCYELYRTREAQDNIRRTMALADCVTVTTKYLKERYADVARRIEVIPNFVPIGDWLKAEPHGLDEFRILWAGSPSHFGDLEVVAQALWKFMRGKAPAKAFFFGREPKNIPEDLKSRVSVTPFCPFADYPYKLAEFKADVALAPLADVDFNRAKSNLKLLEYGACGYPIIASDVGPYQAQKEERNASRILVRNEKEWEDALNLVYSNLDFRGHLREAATEFARTYSVEANAGKIENFFAELVG
jgi:glycosyltransferase involved in cell wall biosynthesis